MVEEQAGRGTCFDSSRLDLFSPGEHSGRSVNEPASHDIRANHTIRFVDPCAHGYSTGGLIFNGKI